MAAAGVAVLGRELDVLRMLASRAAARLQRMRDAARGGAASEEARLDETDATLQLLACLPAGQLFQAAAPLLATSFGRCERWLAETPSFARLAVRLHRAAAAASPPDAGAAAAAAQAMGAALMARGREAEALPHLRAAHDGRAATLSERDLLSADCAELLAVCLVELERKEEAMPLFRSALAARLEALGADDPAVASDERSLALLLMTRGRFDEAADLLEAALKGYTACFGPDHVMSACVGRELAQALLVRRGGRDLDPADASRAEALLRRALYVLAHSLGDPDEETRRCRDVLIGLLKRRERWGALEPLLRVDLALKTEAMLAARGAGGATGELMERWAAASSAAFELGSCLLEAGKLQEAEAKLRAAHDGHRQALGPTHAATLGSLAVLGTALAAQGKLEESEALREEFRAACAAAGIDLAEPELAPGGSE